MTLCGFGTRFSLFMFLIKILESPFQLYALAFESFDARLCGFELLTVAGPLLFQPLLLQLKASISDFSKGENVCPELCAANTFRCCQ
ncbi:MAG: hypothetical protein CMM50_18085 [Rhodospirillaceae bacterium]|nr:hypothetical protein [Rhodospirillaceae bacterium]